jgi:hypothetical protein
VCGTSHPQAHHGAADLGEDAVMAGCCRAPGGWRATVMRLENTPDRHDGQWIRLTQHGFWTSDVHSVAELSRFLPLDALEPDHK